MSVNVTYLFGAGASANVLPIVNDFSQRLSIFAGYFDCIWAKPETDDHLSQYGINESYRVILDDFKRDINWLIDESSNHSSIDTLARKFYLLDRQPELTRLKILLNEFFIIEQLFKGIDKRYDSFFASLLKGEKGNIIIPDNIKILNWNYDKQIEFSFGQFYSVLKPNTIDHDSIIENALQVFPRREHREIDAHKFSLIKLNGTFGSTVDENGNYSQMKYNVYIQKKLSDKQKFDMLMLSLVRYKKNILNSIRHGEIKYSPTIHYAWETDEHLTNLRDKAIGSVFNTQILVVIGYSFPTFNRFVDKNVFNGMKSIKKVYIQNTPNSIDGVIDRFKSLTNWHIPILPIESVEEFFIPFEFS